MQAVDTVCYVRQGVPRSRQFTVLPQRNDTRVRWRLFTGPDQDLKE